MNARSNWIKYFKISAYLIGGLIVFVFSWYSVSRIRGINNRLSLFLLEDIITKSNTSGTNKLEIAAYNIAHGRGGKYGAKNWRYSTVQELLEHLDKIAEQIKKESPDIIVLNETDFSSAWSFHINQAQYIGKKCGYSYILEQINMDVSFPFYRFCFGNAILSRYPIEKKKFIDFQPYSELEDIFAGNHDAFFCELKLPFGPIGVFGIHLEYRSEEIRVQCAELLAEMCSEIEYPIIALGDFNSTPVGLPKSRVSENGKNTMTFLFGKAEFISYLGKKYDKNDYTFPSEAPDRLIDWIIGKEIKKFSGSKNIKSNLSDHFMVVTEVEF